MIILRLVGGNQCKINRNLHTELFLKFSFGNCRDLFFSIYVSYRYWNYKNVYVHLTKKIKSKVKNQFIKN